MKTFCENKPTNYSKATFSGVEQFGAWIDTYKVKPENMPKAGDKVVVKTKSGELHTRTIGAKRIQYASGCIVRLVPDAEIAKKAQERYQTAIDSNKLLQKTTTYNYKAINAVCPRCGSVCYGDCTASA